MMMIMMITIQLIEKSTNVTRINCYEMNCICIAYKAHHTPIIFQRSESLYIGYIYVISGHYLVCMFLQAVLGNSLLSALLVLQKYICAPSRNISIKLHIQEKCITFLETVKDRKGRFEMDLHASRLSIDTQFHQVLSIL